VLIEMTEMVTLQTKKRSVIGKKVRRLRREGWIPGIVYGQGDPLPIQVDHKELDDVYREVGTSALVGLLMGRRKKAQPAIIREIQRHPVSLNILHIDLELIDMNRPLTTHVPVVFKGESPIVEQSESVLTHGVTEVEIRCLPTDVPAQLEVDLSILVDADQTLYVSDLTVPPEVEVLSDPEAVVAYTTSLRQPEEEEVVPTEAELLEGEEAELEEGEEEPAEEEAEE
jgi:large subunit ribosomal protein L25